LYRHVFLPEEPEHCSTAVAIGFKTAAFREKAVPAQGQTTGSHQSLEEELLVVRQTQTRALPETLVCLLGSSTGKNSHPGQTPVAALRQALEVLLPSCLHSIDTSF
jgi:hypothetical protein